MVLSRLPRYPPEHQGAFQSEGVHILSPYIFKQKRGIVQIETHPGPEVACSRKVRQIRNLLNLRVGDPKSQHSRIAQPSQEVNVLSVS